MHEDPTAELGRWAKIDEGILCQVLDIKTAKAEKAGPGIERDFAGKHHYFCRVLLRLRNSADLSQTVPVSMFWVINSSGQGDCAERRFYERRHEALEYAPDVGGIVLGTRQERELQLRFRPPRDADRFVCGLRQTKPVSDLILMPNDAAVGFDYRFILRFDPDACKLPVLWGL